MDAFYGQGWLQIAQLLLAFALTSLIGVERHLRGKKAGLRTQAIVGTASALFMLISKYGFDSVLGPNVNVDPSRVAAQVVSGVGFLGAGLILTHRGTVRGLTTAASVWEASAIGMAAGSGLWLLALVVTALHFVVAYGFSMISRRLPGGLTAHETIIVTYPDGRGLLRRILHVITSAGWAIHESAPHRFEDGTVGVELEISGSRELAVLLAQLSSVESVISVSVAGEIADDS
ncbi:MgtC/SapB family protein [Rothia sp. AR01]|uniref:MgtC/SapB family protein n=1 Tax=Rothia santali TaxID=2949643 RepID=A0A9X2KMI1_9MICC|nr:MgtC/SapB family protein [Rothia santali]MCP3427226.1 MgtC/SapB family protein [Rothia santali]